VGSTPASYSGGSGFISVVILLLTLIILYTSTKRRAEIRVCFFSLYSFIRVVSSNSRDVDSEIFQ
jgi:prolipoprotein diacylglyceryltransferase